MLQNISHAPSAQPSHFPIPLTERQRLIIRLEYQNLRDDTSCHSLFWIEHDLRRVFCGIDWGVVRYALVNGYQLYGVSNDYPPYPVSSFESYENFSDAQLHVAVYGVGTWKDILKRYDLRLHSAVKTKVYESTDRSKVIWKIAKALGERGACGEEIKVVLLASTCWQSKHGNDERKLEQLIRKVS